MFKKEFQIFLKDDKKLRELFEGQKTFTQFDKNEVYAKPFDIPKPNNFILPDNYPDCCEYHKGITAHIEDWFIRFPNCCKRHQGYQKLEWFAKDNFLNVPEKIRVQLNYTEYHIEEHIQDVDWYKKITDYIEYNIRSFGSPEVGADRYVIILEHYIRYAETETSKIDEEKRKLLLEYFNREKESEKEQKTDLNILLSTFNKWVKTIPNIGLFSSIKEQLTNKFPINLILYNGEYNPYLGETKFRTRIRSELIGILVQVTKDTLLIISNDNKYTVTNSTIVEEKHRLRQNRLSQEYSKGEIKYIKILKKWLKNEKQFFRDIQRISELNVPQKISTATNTNVEYGEIDKKIAANELLEALELMYSICKEKSQDHLIKQIIQQKGRYNEIKNRFDMGTVSDEDYMLEINRIRSATLNLKENITG